MTYKILRGAYPAGYRVANDVSLLIIKSTASVGGGGGRRRPYGRDIPDDDRKQRHGE